MYTVSKTVEKIQRTTMKVVDEVRETVNAAVSWLWGSVCWLAGKVYEALPETIQRR